MDRRTRVAAGARRATASDYPRPKLTRRSIIPGANVAGQTQQAWGIDDGTDSEVSDVEEVVEEGRGGGVISHDIHEDTTIFERVDEDVDHDAPIRAVLLLSVHESAEGA